jgi:hypothetical protein
MGRFLVDNANYAEGVLYHNEVALGDKYKWSIIFPKGISFLMNIYFYILKNIFALGFIFCMVWMFRNKVEKRRTASLTIRLAIGFFALSTLFWILDLSN